MKKHFSDYYTIFLFLCGLSALKLNEAYQLVYSKLTPNDIVPVLRCMYEIDHMVLQALQLSVKPFALNMAYNILVPYDCLCVSHVISYCPVTQLNMENCMIENKGAEALVKHCHNKKTANQILESVDLSKNNLTALGMTHVAKMVRKSKNAII